MTENLDKIETLEQQLPEGSEELPPFDLEEDKVDDVDYVQVEEDLDAEQVA